MLATRFLLAVLSGGIASSCDAPPLQQAEPVLANTVWVPRVIAWERPHPHDAELSGIRYASFTLLAFRARGRRLLVSSIHSRGDQDTILAATEPGVQVDSGRYRVAANRVIITSKNLTHTFTPPHPGTLYDERTDTLSFAGGTLRYKGIAYRPYTKLAGQRIASFWALW
ncbi:MAG TPA: hypothetical protein VF629_13990 [Hymenobacter sp.]|jgi:hypothetical protein|uniref:hypothetical protein n=1 Tax=Hymenobacter sp. TaxID=1898978 RepID=UPI002ED7BAF0